MRAIRRNLSRPKLLTSNSNVTNALVNINININFRDFLKFRDVRTSVNNHRHEPRHVRWLPKSLGRWMVIGAILVPSLLVGDSFTGYDTAAWVDVSTSPATRMISDCYDPGRLMPKEHTYTEP